MDTMEAFLSAHPDLKFVFTGGKGGVGKTIAAAGFVEAARTIGVLILLALVLYQAPELIARLRASWQAAHLEARTEEVPAA